MPKTMTSIGIVLLFFMRILESCQTQATCNKITRAQRDLVVSTVDEG
jgi:hypothetical protein